GGGPRRIRSLLLGRAPQARAVARPAEHPGAKGYPPFRRHRGVLLPDELDRTLNPEHTESMRMAIYPGSFDPLTNGHLSIIQRGLQMFDVLLVALAIKPNKTSLFSVAERKEIIREAVTDPRVEIDDFEGLLVRYAKRRNVSVILRGLRAISDFDYEFQMANMNRKLAPE